MITFNGRNVIKIALKLLGTKCYLLLIIHNKVTELGR